MNWWPPNTGPNAPDRRKFIRERHMRWNTAITLIWFAGLAALLIGVGVGLVLCTL